MAFDLSKVGGNSRAEAKVDVIEVRQSSFDTEAVHG